MTETSQETGTQLATQGQELCTQANALTVTDTESYGAAAAFQKDCKALEQSMLDFMDPLCETANKAHKATTTRRKELVGPVQKAMKTAGTLMGQYRAKCEQERQAEEARLRDQEQRRIDAEALGYAEALEEQGHAEAASDVLEHIPKAEVVAESHAPKVAGTVTRTNWHFEIMDEGSVPREYCIPDVKAIGALVRARKGKIDIPGVRIYSETSVGQRG